MFSTSLTLRDQAERVVDVADHLWRELRQSCAARSVSITADRSRSRHMGQEAFGTRDVQHRDELVVAFTDPPELFLQDGKQLGLDVSPIV